MSDKVPGEIPAPAVIAKEATRTWTILPGPTGLLFSVLGAIRRDQHH